MACGPQVGHPGPTGSEGIWPQRYLDFRRLASRTVKQISVVLRHPVHGTLLQQPQETNTVQNISSILLLVLSEPQSIL